MRGTGDARTFSNIAATTAAFTLYGGLYQMTAVATWGGGSVALQTLGPDGTTWLGSPTTAGLTANGGYQAYLPPGQYRFAVVTASAVYINLTRVPTE